MNLPAIDDPDLRKENTKRIVESVENVGQHFKELKKQNRVNFVIGGITALIILLFLCLVIYSAYSAGGSFIDNLVDKNALTRRYECTYNGYNTTFRMASNALDFKELYNDTECNFYIIED